MTARSIAVEAHLSVCPDGYECYGRAVSEGGIAWAREGVPGGIKVLASKTQENRLVVVSKLSTIWKSLVRIANVSEVSGPEKVRSELLKFTNQFGLLTLETTRQNTAPQQSIFIDSAVHESRRLVNAIRCARGNFVEMPADVLDAVEMGVTLSLGSIGGHQTLSIEGGLLAAWFDLANRRLPVRDDCAFCRGVNVSRLGSLFCSDYCRDRHHKKSLRS